jgi:1,4-dihydroxy-2-naphthoate octaprenyltransferase
MNQPQTPTNFQLLLRYIHPWMLLAGVVSYILGSGIARYLGYGVFDIRFWGGMLAVVLLQLASYMLKLYYDLVEAGGPLRQIRRDFEDIDKITAKRLSKSSVLFLSFTILAAGAAITVLLVSQGAMHFSGVLILGAAFLVAFFYGVPPLRLAYKGYGELSEAVLISSLFPALGFIIQTGDLHRLLAMITFPLLALFLAMRLAQSLEHYGRDQKLAHQTMMIVLGWQRGMQFHNVLILIGYLLLGVAFSFGLPWSLTWPGLLTLPIGLFQIFQMSQIANGGKPSWRLLRLTSLATFGLTLYFLTLAIWTV